jgi:Tol biopolymer transport system component
LVNNQKPTKALALSNPDGSNNNALRSGDAATADLVSRWKRAFWLTFGPFKIARLSPTFDVAKTRSPAIFFTDKRVTDVRWMPDGRGMIVLTSTKYELLTRAGRLISYPEGKFEPVTNDTNNYNTLSLSGDGRTLTTIQSQQVGELDMLAATGGAAGSPIPGLANQLQQTRNVAWLNDSEFLLMQPDRILRVSSDGAKQTELFSDNSVSLGGVAVCQTGHTIVIRMRGREGSDTGQIWRMDADGSNPKRLTNGKDDFRPLCSPQGKWLYYYEGKNVAWMRIPLEGGTPELLPPNGVPGSPTFPPSSISRDGRLMAEYGTVVDKATNTYKSAIAIINTDSFTAPPLVLPADPRITVANGGAQFTPDNQAIVYTIRGENNVDNLWLQPLNGKPGRQITQFQSDQIPGFGWSPDGKKLLIGRGHTESDVVLLRDTSK